MTTRKESMMAARGMLTMGRRGTLKMNRKGFGLTLDAIIAILFIMAISLAISAYRFTQTTETSRSAFLNLHYVSEDVLDVMNKEGVLDQIGEYWVSGNTTNASGLAEEYLDTLVPQNMGYRLMFDNSTVAENNRVAEIGSIAETHSVRLLAGYTENQSVFGSSARAFLTDISGKSSSAYAYFGGFEGQGNLTEYVHVPTGVTITGAYMEMDAGSSFNMYVNGKGNPCNNPHAAGGSYLEADIQEDISSCGFDPGQNTVEIEFTGPDIEDQYIGGGFIRVDYNTTQLAEGEETGEGEYEFPGIDGFINHYDSFYIPGDVEQMAIHLEFGNNYTTFLRIGDTLVYNSTGSPNTQIVDLNNNYLNGKLNYNTLGGATVPIRLGTTNISSIVQEGNADVILITDLSGSMRWRIGDETEINGVIRACNDSNLFNSTTRRASLAKCLDKDFVEIIMNGTGNRVGLVGFTDDADDSDYNLDLTTDRDAVTDKIDDYPSGTSGGTCICCAINKAYEMLEDEVQVVIDAGSSWKSKSYNPCGDSCNPTTLGSSCVPSPGDWKATGFDDGSWGSTTLPTENNNQARAYYYRKHFTISSEALNNGTLYVRNRRGVECYLNGNLIGTDTSCRSGSYWDHEWSVPAVYFNDAGVDNVVACRLRSGSGSSRRGIEFDAQLTLPSSKNNYIIVMSDGITAYCCDEDDWHCDEEGTDTEGQYSDCGGNQDDCEGGQCDGAISNAIWSAERAHTDSNVHAKINAVGFGPVADCENGNYTLHQIAEEGDGAYCASTNASELQDCYVQYAQWIVEGSIRSQIVNLSESFTPSILYPSSYISYTYTPISAPLEYGEILMSYDTPRFNNNATCQGMFYIPASARVVDTKATSYSSEHWTHYLHTEPSSYSWYLSDYGSSYFSLGDPYIISIPANYVESGSNNTVTVTTGDSVDNGTGCSIDNRAIITIAISGSADYGNVLSTANGCNWNIEFEDDSTLEGPIPSDYGGALECSYTGSNVTSGYTDALADAVYRLLQGMDVDGNGKVDITFDMDQIDMDFSRVGGIRSLWGPAQLKLIVWI